MIAKIILICVLLIVVMRCVEPIPSAEEVRKIIESNQDTIKAQRWRMAKEYEEYQMYFQEIERQRKDARNYAREIMRTSLDKNMSDFCDSYSEEVLSFVREMIEQMKDGHTMQPQFNNIPLKIAFCIMDVLMTSNYSVDYHVNDRKLIFDYNKPFDHSRIIIYKHELCGNTIVYAIPCGLDKTNCMMFQLEFNTFKNEDTTDYLGMEQIGIIESMTMCM